MKDEFKALQRNNTWEYTPKPKDRKLLTTRWIFKKKIDQSGESRYKARLMVRGCAQEEGIDYSETFSPVVRYTNIRYLLSP